MECEFGWRAFWNNELKPFLTGGIKPLCKLVFLMTLDHVVYRCGVSALGSLTGGYFAKLMYLDAAWEILISLLFTISILYFIWYLRIEKSFVKPLVLREGLMKFILLIRDFVTFIATARAVARLVRLICHATNNSGMKEKNLSDGVMYVIMMNLPVSQYYLDAWAPYHSIFGGQDIPKDFITSAEISLAFTFIGCCVAQIVYFNSIKTFLSATYAFFELLPELQERWRKKKEAEDAIDVQSLSLASPHSAGLESPLFSDHHVQTDVEFWDFSDSDLINRNIEGMNTPEVERLLQDQRSTELTSHHDQGIVEHNLQEVF